MQISIREDDPLGRAVGRLITAHLDNSVRHSPPESIHALDPASLRAPDITFWTAWEGDRLLGCAALKELDRRHGEIKSMHVAEACRGRGVGARLLTHILDEARGRAYQRVNLETGRMVAYAVAQGLYRRFGFAPCGPFADYREDPNSLYMTLEPTV